MDIKVTFILKDSFWGFSDLLDGRSLDNSTRQEIEDFILENLDLSLRSIDLSDFKIDEIKEAEEYCECNEPILGEGSAKCGNCNEYFKPFKL